MQCRWWVLPCPTIVSFPKFGQTFTTMTNQAVNHKAVCTPLVSEEMTENQHENNLDKTSTG